jgi:hypothetical protein
MTTTPTPGRLEPGTGPIDLDLVIHYLAGSVGVEKARSLVTESLRFLQVEEGPTLSWSNCALMLEKLSAQQGLVGIAARVTKIKLQLRVESSK